MLCNSNMINSNTTYILTLVQHNIIIPLDVLFILLTFCWAWILVKRILIDFKLYKTYLREGDSKNASESKSNVVKFVFLLLININECITMQLYSGCSWILSGYTYVLNRPVQSNCSKELISSGIFDIELIINSPIKAFMVVLLQVNMLFYLGFIICLMHFLHITFHSIPLNPFRFIRRFLLFTSILSLLLVITGTVPQLILFEKLVEPLIELAYFLIWYRYTRMFYQTLKWRTNEFRIRRPKLVKTSVENRIKFAVVMFSMGLGFLLNVFVNLLASYGLFSSVVLHYGPCLFNYLYGTPFYQTSLVSDRHADTQLFNHKIYLFVTFSFLSLALLIIGSQYLLISLVYLVTYLRKKLCVRFELNPSLTKRLLKNQH